MINSAYKFGKSLIAVMGTLAGTECSALGNEWSKSP